MKTRKLTAVLMTVVMVFSILISPTGSIAVRAEGTEDGNYGDVIELPSGTIGYTSKSKECRQIPNETQKGIYFLNDKELNFYSFATGESELIYTFDEVKDSYVAGGKLYTIERSGKKINVYNLDSMNFEKTISVEFYPNAIGVDDQGRIYIACYIDSYQICLLDPEGQVLSQDAAPSEIYNFGGFDSVTGNFYFECYYNWYYYVDHDTRALGIGNVSGNSIEVYDRILQTLSQIGYNDRQRGIELLGEKYLCVDTPLYATGNVMAPANSGLFVWDSHENDISSESFTIKVALGRSYTTNLLDSVGPRCAYNEENDSIITYTGGTTLAEYSLETKAFVGTYRTSYPVFSLETYGDSIVAIERDNDNFYLELIEWKHADELEIVNGSSKMKAGESVQLEVSSNGNVEEEYTWETSDSKIVSITQAGEVYAWHEGTATVTITNVSGVTASITITVEPRTETGETYQDSLTLTGTLSSNISKNNYSNRNWSSPMNSYLVDNEDGTLSRVEYVKDSVLVEQYDKKTDESKDSKTILLELPLFGGFYSGAEYNYLVFGQVNEDESDETEVLRIVKYSKEWERLNSVSIKGANTYIPFEAGSLRMTETAGKLYVYTCHKMYKNAKDGLNHQSNMTFVIDESTMGVLDFYYDVMNIAQAGYVSHSFNQFIQTDGRFVYRVDHGDSYPTRAISITRCGAGDSIKNVKYTLPYNISGTSGNNYTGVSIGGFELSSDACLIAGNSAKQDGTSTNFNSQRNIFLTVTDKLFNGTELLWLTDYTDDDKIEVRTPQLVKLGKDQFLLMWEEVKGSGSVTTRMVTIDGYGNCTSDMITSAMRLSDCHPIVGKDGLVRWYQTDGEAVTLYTIDPLELLSYAKGEDPGGEDPGGEDPSGEDPGGDIELPIDTVELPDGTVNYADYGLDYIECRQIPNETRKGIYFLNGDELIFYSFVTGKSQLVYTFKKMKDSYVAGGKLYALRTGSKEIDVYDLDAKAFEKTIPLDPDINFNRIGADGEGRIYLSDLTYDKETDTYHSQIYLLDAEGRTLSQTAAPSRVYDFGGFDSVTGNFYFECNYKWNYNDMIALGAGNVSGDSVKICDNVLQTISRNRYNNRQRSMELLGDKYLCVDAPYFVTGNSYNPYYSGLFIWDSHENDISSDSFSWQMVLGSSYVTNGRYPCNETVGPRCAYNEENDSIITYIDDCTLAEYSVETESCIGIYHTAHPVFSLETYGDYIIAIELDDGVYYLEMIEWKHADNLEIVNGSSKMKAGETMQLDVVSNGNVEEEYTWETSDSKIVSTTKDGKVFGWHEGTADVTVSNRAGVTASITITVESRTETGETYPGSLTLDGMQSAYANISLNNYSVWSSTVGSYLVDNEDGTLSRVENMGTYVLVEIYDKETDELKDSKQLALEISEDAFFGGFYSGAEYNYLVFGQENLDKNDETEVVRIVKYSKDWERLDEASVYGAYTMKPFDSGSLRMTETADRLYVYTSHDMYFSNDRYKYQTSMTFVIDENTMEIEDSYYMWGNIGAGCVSHSFNQFIQTDGTFVYRVDHGNANPRAVSITRCIVGDSIKNVSYMLPYEISGEFEDDYTGVSVGGFELSSDTCLIAGNSVKQDGTSEEYYGQRNIFLTVTDKSLSNTKVVWFTDYTDGSIEVRTPHLVKLGEDQFLLMWEERNTNSGSIVTRMVTIDGYGNCTSDVNDFDLRLSDCQPIVDADGLVRWYQTDGEKVTLCAVDPLELSISSNMKKKGDANGDGKINAIDALLVLQHVAGLPVLDEDEKKLVDMDENGRISANDALKILEYVAGYRD